MAKAQIPCNLPSYSKRLDDAFESVDSLAENELTPPETSAATKCEECGVSTSTIALCSDVSLRISTERRPSSYLDLVEDGDWAFGGGVAFSFDQKQ